MKEETISEYDQDRTVTVELTLRELNMLDRAINTRITVINNSRVAQAKNVDMEGLAASLKLSNWWVDLSMKVSKALLKIA